jgi:hypothetical protein
MSRPVLTNCPGDTKTVFFTNFSNVLISQWLDYVHTHVIHKLTSLLYWNWAENHSKYAMV